MSLEAVKATRARVQQMRDAAHAEVCGALCLEFPLHRAASRLCCSYRDLQIYQARAMGKTVEPELEGYVASLDAALSRLQFDGAPGRQVCFPSLLLHDTSNAKPHVAVSALEGKSKLQGGAFTSYRTADASTVI